jgi:hypothetical protein
MSILPRISRHITDRNLCVRCLSLALELDEEATQAAIDTLATSVLIIKASALCASCNTEKPTLRMPTRY